MERAPSGPREPDDRSGEPRAIAFGRLSLFGPGAARLHDELEGDTMKPQREQLESERQDMRKRLGRIEDEIRDEPAELEALYHVSLKRLAPVGLVYLWPTTSL
ncbi:hypothetical protein [Sorangium sp. So ce854]|uniref:hypothetical protein n=1 Tax=Sorangium sp. So ce854 TaxID=3133322 RepID=UPI003F613A21